MYERALERGVFPTAHMTTTYAHALVATREHDAAVALYEQCRRDDRPLNVFFYRQLLFCAAVTQRTALATQLIDDMKLKGLELRAEDYWHAVRAFDRAYFVTKDRHGDKHGKHLDADADTDDSKWVVVRESWRDCQQRLRAAPDPRRDEACDAVLQLVDDMVDTERLVPRRAAFVDRALAAAVFTRDYERVDELLELRRQCRDADDSHGSNSKSATAVSMATNARLLRGDPDRALDDLLSLDAAIASVDGRHAARNLVAYLCSVDDVSRLRALLQVLDERRAQRAVVDKSMLKAVVASLCRSAEQLDDDTLWNDVLTKWAPLFRMHNTPAAFTMVLEHASAAGRWSLVTKCLNHRDKTVLRGVYPRLAIHIMRSVTAAATQGEEDERRHRVLTTLLRDVEWSRCSPEQRVTLAALAIPALHAKRDSERIARIVHKATGARRPSRAAAGRAGDRRYSRLTANINAIKWELFTWLPFYVRIVFVTYRPIVYQVHNTPTAAGRATHH
ncbi:hypothetical protein PINS_up017847 [Pythium insidiosum]|nr:hypothetical protein PINS_up017847 [Pythium insidiosum]